MADESGLDAWFVEQFVSAHERAPVSIVLDVDATDDPLHGHQEGRFFHGYYRSYCYLPLYIFCGEHLLCARLRPSNIDGAPGTVEELERIIAQIRRSWHWRRTRASLRPWPASLHKPESSMKARLSRRGCFVTSSTRPARAGLARGALSVKPST